MGVYMVKYRSKDKNTTQDNLAELVGRPVALIWCKWFSFFRVVRSLFSTICASNEENVLLAGTFDEYRDSYRALRRNCHGQSIGKVDCIF